MLLLWLLIIIFVEGVEQNDNESIKQQFENQLFIDPNNTNLLVKYGDLLREKYSDYNQSKWCYDRALSINPNISLAHQGIAYLLQHSDCNQAIKHIKFALEIEPKNEEYWYNYGCLLFNKFGYNEESILCLQTAISLNESYGEAYHGLGIMLIYYIKNLVVFIIMRVNGAMKKQYN